MTWKIKGKIGCHFPDRTGLNPNFDVARIVYSQDGVAANAKEIEKVYYISPAAATAIAAQTTHEARMAELAKWLVWQRYWSVQRTLVAGDKLVAIQYKPTSDIYVQTIEIFTTSSQGNNDKARVKILHESGLYIAAFNADNGPDSATEYQLIGYKRYVNNQNVLLKGGKTYYIVYQHDDESPGENTFWPAYFDGENGVYKEYNNSRDSVSTTDITNFGDYIGEINTVGQITGASTNQFFVWSGYDLTNLIKMNSLYIRNSSYHNTYGGEIGEQAAITPEIKDTVLSLDDDSLFVWIGWGDSNNHLVYNELHQRIGTTLARTKYKGIKTTIDALLDDLDKDDYAVFKGSDSQLSNNTIYKKNQNIKIDAVLDFSQSSNSFDNLVALIKASYNADGNKNIATKGTIYNRNLTGYVMTLKSGYTYDFNTNDSGYTPSELTTSKVQTGCMYYMNTGGTPAAGSVYENPGILLWNGSSFEAVAYTTYDGSYISYFDYITLVDALTVVSFGDAISHIGTADLLVENTSYSGEGVISNTLRSATIGNRKYYLKINGNEV